MRDLRYTLALWMTAKRDPLSLPWMNVQTSVDAWCEWLEEQDPRFRKYALSTLRKEVIAQAKRVGRYDEAQPDTVQKAT